MKETQQIELPPSFIHRVVQVSRHEQSLVCDRFTLSSKFPNNIVLLTGNRIMYCTAFSEERFTGDVHARRYYMTGFIFSSVRSVWFDPCESSRIGLNFASRLGFEFVTVTGMELVGKCFIHARALTPPDRLFEPLVDPCPPEIQPVLRQWRESRTVEARTSFSEEILSLAMKYKAIGVSCALDYWWVWSLIVPGRYTNHFQ